MHQEQMQMIVNVLHNIWLILSVYVLFMYASIGFSFAAHPSTYFLNLFGLCFYISFFQFLLNYEN